MHREQGVRCVSIAQVLQLGGESRDVVGKGSRLGKPRRLDHGRNRGRGTFRGLLLHVAPEVGLDVDDDLTPVLRGLLHEHLEARVVRAHRGRVVQVAVVAVELAAPGAGCGLQQLVPREHRHVARGGRAAAGHVVERELSRGLGRVLPGEPVVLRVDPTREVGESIFPGNPARRHPIDVGVAQAELQP